MTTHNYCRRSIAQIYKYENRSIWTWLEEAIINLKQWHWEDKSILKTGKITSNQLNNQGKVLKSPHTSKHGSQYLRHKGDFSLHYKPSPNEAKTKMLLFIQASNIEPVTWDDKPQNAFNHSQMKGSNKINNLLNMLDGQHKRQKKKKIILSWKRKSTPVLLKYPKWAQLLMCIFIFFLFIWWGNIKVYPKWARLLMFIFILFRFNWWGNIKV